MVKVKFDDLVFALEMQHPEAENLIDLTTGECCFIPYEDINAIESGDFDSEQLDELKILAKDFLENPSNYISLPTQYEINNFRIMEDFARNLDDEKVANKLFSCLVYCFRYTKKPASSL